MFVKERVYPQWFIDELYKPEDKIKAKDGDLKSSEYCTFICNDCGNIFETQQANHLKGQGCLEHCPTTKKQQNNL